MTRYDGKIHVYEHQYYLHDSVQTATPPYRLDDTGLARFAEDGGIQVISGANTGSLAMSVDLVEAAPPVPFDDWDEIVEVSYATTTGDAQLLGWPATPQRWLPAISHAGPGSYRLRFHARDRDDPRNARPFEIVEAHHLAVWPGPPAPTVAHKYTDATGRYWRSIRDTR
ncbi:hypothetical protein AAH979_19130 [Plantactinospora sp. ZYX-F-223]|uniref:hypothetical protein n=1 Tax=Plantactinospora sp. ZYX-F-223 TaxID=3144103 RepID=UPI0031FCE2BD